MTSVFTYGTLVFPDVMEAVTGRRPPRAAATLRGYTSFRVEGAVYPAAVAAPGASLEGALYRGLEVAELSLLDRFEGDLYDRRELRVRTDGGAAERAFVYVLGEASRHLLTGEPWSAADFERRHLARYLRGARAFHADARGAQP